MDGRVGWRQGGWHVIQRCGNPFISSRWAKTQQRLGLAMKIG